LIEDNGRPGGSSRLAAIGKHGRAVGLRTWLGNSDS
jgi:hypothetical protein